MKNLVLNNYIYICHKTEMEFITISREIFSKSSSLINKSNESNYSKWSMSSPCVLKPWRTVIYLKKTWHKILKCGKDNKILYVTWMDKCYNENS